MANHDFTRSNWCLGLVTGFVLGCGGGSAYEPTASLLVNWDIGGADCTDVGLAEVAITLSTADGEVDTVWAACQIRQYLFRAIPEGAYTVDIQAFPANSDVATHAGVVGNVTVRAGAENVACVAGSVAGGALATCSPIHLEEKAVDYAVAWKFRNGELCSTNGVDRVEVYVWDEHNRNVDSQSCSCDLSSAELAPGVPSRCMDDGMHFLLYAGNYTLSAQGWNLDAGSATFWADHKVAVDHVASPGAKLILEDCSSKPNTKLCRLTR